MPEGGIDDEFKVSVAMAGSCLLVLLLLFSTPSCPHHPALLGQLLAKFLNLFCKLILSLKYSLQISAPLVLALLFPLVDPVPHLVCAQDILQTTLAFTPGENKTVLCVFIQVASAHPC